MMTKPRSHPLFLLLLPLLSLALGPGLPAAQSLPRTWEPDGTVRALALSAQHLYLGGDFTTLGPHTGNVALFLTATGQLQAAFPTFEHYGSWGRAAIGDGAGGWYVSSDSYQVTNPDGTPDLTGRLVHVLATGKVDPLFNPAPDNSVRALALYGGRLYVGGAFASIGGQPQAFLAAVDPVSGSLLPWAPGLDNGVQDLALNGTQLLVAGDFGGVGGVARASLASFELSATAGTLTAWDPQANGGVDRVLAAGAKAYVAGAFTAVGGQARNYFAELDSGGTTGVATAFDAQVVAAPGGQGWAVAFDPLGGKLYVGGSFTTAQGQPRANAACFDLLAGGALDAAWACNSSGGGVYDLALGNGQAYVAGWFSGINGVVRHGLARVDAASGALDPWDPCMGGAVDRVALSSGGLLLALGDFWQAGGVDRQGVASLNLATGLPDAFACDVTRSVGTASVEALALSGTTLVLGGAFDSVKGLPRTGLAAVDAGSGAVLPWDPAPNGEVRALALGNGLAYFGGAFTAVAGAAPRSSLAAAPLGGVGTPSAFDPGCDGTVSALLLDGSALYVGGSFGALGGALRASLGAVDASGSTGWALAFAPQPNSAVFALAGGGGALYAGGAFTQVGGQARQRLARLNADGTAYAAFNAGPINGSVQSLSLLNDVLYYGGSFTSAGSYLSGAMTGTGALSLAAQWGWLWASGDVLALASVQLAASTASDLYSGGAFLSTEDGFRVHLNGELDDLSGNPYWGTNVGTGSGQNGFRFFPQPVRQGQLCGSVAANAGDSIEIRLYNSIHQLAAVIHRQAGPNAGSEHFCEDASSLAPGLYSARVAVNGRSLGAANLVVGR